MAAINVGDKHAKPALKPVGIIVSDFDDMPGRYNRIPGGPLPNTSTKLDSAVVDEILSFLRRMDQHIRDTVSITLSGNRAEFSLTAYEHTKTKTAMEDARRDLVAA
ncbi:unnamed protein product [Zymoseptoria tritici ST99CH_1E4]|uniref:Uncharacterized protein n=1 Tax=Zymoseptoria tritici ST99CH_1E4 TaxID=1276532 RepID=A0A2H1H8S9_ZYMTR|nr:unnamed protein product [Zymoseptoria tritici ST99CH_1E4]